MKLGKPKPILLVEDDKIDAANVRRAFERNGIANTLHIVGDGKEALAFLRREGEYGGPKPAPRPCVILLDIGMPVMDGIEFLREAKADADLRSIPVVVLTTSTEESSRVESFQLGVAGYIVKDFEFDKFVDAIGVFDRYWSINELP